MMNQQRKSMAQFNFTESYSALDSVLAIAGNRRLTESCSRAQIS